jgi:hypothetical protein
MRDPVPGRNPPAMRGVHARQPAVGPRAGLAVLYPLPGKDRAPPTGRADDLSK